MHKPVWRGINSNFVNLDDYKPGTIGYFPGFTSTSKEKDVAFGISLGESLGNEPMVFKIYLSADNDPVTHIELP